MTIKEALNRRIPRIRKPQWANPSAYLRLPLLADKTIGPWGELYDDQVQLDVLKIRPGSQRILSIIPDDGYEVYTGQPSPYETHEKNFARVYTEN